jgi:hypothetical protein
MKRLELMTIFLQFTSKQLLNLCVLMDRNFKTEAYDYSTKHR